MKIMTFFIKSVTGRGFINKIYSKKGVVIVMEVNKENDGINVVGMVTETQKVNRKIKIRHIIKNELK